MLQIRKQITQTKAHEVSSKIEEMSDLLLQLGEQEQQDFGYGIILANQFFKKQFGKIGSFLQAPVKEQTHFLKTVEALYQRNVSRSLYIALGINYVAFWLETALLHDRESMEKISKEMSAYIQKASVFFESKVSNLS